MLAMAQRVEVVADDGCSGESDFIVEALEQIESCIKPTDEDDGRDDEGEGR